MLAVHEQVESAYCGCVCIHKPLFVGRRGILELVNGRIAQYFKHFAGVGNNQRFKAAQGCDEGSHSEESFVAGYRAWKPR